MQSWEQQKQSRLDNIDTQLESIECQHAKTEIRYRLASNGSRMFKPQCLRCGEVIGKNWIPHSTIPNINNCKPIDDGLRQFNIDLKITLSKELNARKANIQRTEFFEDYNEYLQSFEWADRRQKVLARCKWICEGCGKNRAVQVHHLTYQHYRHEFLFELVGICKECHDTLHEKQDNQDAALNA
jgi:hypothetical protein